MTRAKACAKVVLPTPGTPSSNRCPRAKIETSAKRTTSSLPRMTERKALSNWPTRVARPAAVLGDIAAILAGLARETELPKLRSEHGGWRNGRGRPCAFRLALPRLPLDCPRQSLIQRSLGCLVLFGRNRALMAVNFELE